MRPCPSPGVRYHAADCAVPGLRRGRQALYIGITSNLQSRISNHQAQKEWWEDARRTSVSWYPTREEAAVAESLAIRAEKPAHNIKHSVRPRSKPGVSPDEVSRAEGHLTAAAALRLAAVLILGHAEEMTAEISKTIRETATKKADYLEGMAAGLLVKAERILGPGLSKEIDKICGEEGQACRLRLAETDAA